jgi:branched-chain amino acid transport system ATP-binding protein
MSDEPLLKVNDLHAGYGDVGVLWGVDLEVRQDEIVCLLGSNGAGKTTLMRTLSSLVRPSAGSIRFDGRELSTSERA